MHYIYELDHDFVSMKKHLLAKHEFYENFGKGVEQYILGDWVNAQTSLANAMFLMPGDGPSSYLSEYMEMSKNMPPDGWKGYRDLDKKQADPPEFDSAMMGRTGNDGTMDQDANPEGAAANQGEGTSDLLAKD